MTSEMQIALVGVAGTLLGTVIGWVLNYLSTRGKLKIYPTSLNHDFLYDRGNGVQSHAKTLNNTNVYRYYFELDIYNSSNDFKIMREIQLCFSRNKTILLKDFPTDKDDIEISLLNIQPKYANKIVLANEIRTQKNINAVYDSSKVYLSYKNEKNKKKKFLIAEYNSHNSFDNLEVKK